MKKKNLWKDVRTKKLFKNKKDINKFVETKFVIDWNFLKKHIYKELPYER